MFSLIRACSWFYLSGLQLHQAERWDLNISSSLLNKMSVILLGKTKRCFIDPSIESLYNLANICIILDYFCWGFILLHTSSDIGRSRLANNNINIWTIQYVYLRKLPLWNNQQDWWVTMTIAVLLIVTLLSEAFWCYWASKSVKVLYEIGGCVLSSLAWKRWLYLTNIMVLDRIYRGIYNG